ncbi:TlyA family RNA methyltransferase [Parvularcula sp. IMCC14364]|uniref:TlyA family RNA methyltransferase n=1 Tax=Parvularcula sp. IMCC14364 TaxID=3067902 RepID=UPI00274058FF|nr:TlyA family RNA methyltransferase [Parvularcula sp. IMCC14364]
MRLDLYLVDHGYCDSRARAQAAIKAGRVLLNGATARKASHTVGPGDQVVFEGQAFEYVSRGGLKLEAALKGFDISPAGKVCLDLGASTGGFTDVLLRAGAEKVYAVDVGHGQLHPEIAQSSRVINLERTHVKDLSLAHVPEPIEILVCDVSFISLRKALPPAMALCAPLAQLLALVKPQFEVGRAEIGKGGIVRQTPENTVGTAQKLAQWLEGQSWRVFGLTESPIKGGDGNTEFLIGATNQT